MAAFVSLDATTFEQVVSKIESYGEGAADIVTKAIHESGEDIYRKIDPLLPTSGRTFKGHSSGARGTQWARYLTNEPLAITVTTKSSRNYLYFPDDGSNTKRHRGNQQFMRRGGEAAVPEIIDKSLKALVEHFEKG